VCAKRIMAFLRLFLPFVLLILAFLVDGNATITAMTVKSETKPLTDALLTNLTSVGAPTTRTTIAESSQPVINSEFKRGQYTLFIVFCVTVQISSVTRDLMLIQHNKF